MKHILNDCPSWISERDVVLSGLDGADLAVIRPNSDLPVLLSVRKADLPPARLKDLSLKDLKVSTRSCIAQSGIFLYLEQEFLRKDEIDDLERGKAVNILGKLKNYGLNSLEFRLGDTLARFFYPNPKDRVVGEDLRDLVDGGLLLGVEGKDYLVFGEEEVCVVAMKVSSQRAYIPRIYKRKSIRVTSRSDLYGLTKIVDEKTPEKDLSCLFHLLTTRCEVNLPVGVMGELSVVTSKKDVVHLPSRLIDPGSHWAVRLEIIGGQPDWILMKFYRNEKLKIDVRDKRGSFDKTLLLT